MKNIEISRTVDELGRVVLPAEVRTALHLKKGDTCNLVLDREAQTLTVKKQTRVCLCCQGQDGLKQLPNGNYLCEECLAMVQ